MPWGDDYWRISSNGTKTSIQAQISCDNMGDDEAESIRRCQEFVDQINATKTPVLNGSGGSGCTGPNNNATGAAIRAQCTFRTP